MKKTPGGKLIVCQNRKARYEYHILETLEAGIKLTGTEIKSVRGHHVSLDGAFVSMVENQPTLIGCNIDPFENGNIYNHEPKRNRTLLMHKREIQNFLGKAKEKGLTIVPLTLYLVKGKAKLELALAKGKQLHDKRQAIKDRDLSRMKEY
jgi:SsrA-binding protein